MGRKKTKIRVGEKIKYQRPLGGAVDVRIDRIEADVSEISMEDLTKPTTTVYLDNGKWISGKDLAEQFNVTS